MLGGLFLIPFLYLIIGRKFDRLLKQHLGPLDFLDASCRLSGNPVLSPVFRTVTYSYLILYNYVPRLEKMKQRKQQHQRLGLWNTFWCKNYDYWYQVFLGYDFRANASRLEQWLAALFFAATGVLLVCILLSGWNDDINQYYCGVPPKQEVY